MAGPVGHASTCWTASRPLVLDAGRFAAARVLATDAVGAARGC